MNSMREQCEAWDAYVAARDKAANSNDIKDGVAAGRAWRAFISLFVPGSEGSTATVIPFMEGRKHGAD